MTDTDMAVALIALLVILGLGFGLIGWLSDKWIERNRPTLPKPQARAVAGESWRRWM